MTTYPAYINCPNCALVAANVSLPLSELVLRIAANQDKLDRFLLRTDQDKPGPSHRLVVCQHCHYPFRIQVRRIIDQPRTV